MQTPSYGHFKLNHYDNLDFSRQTQFGLVKKKMCGSTLSVCRIPMIFVWFLPVLIPSWFCQILSDVRCSYFRGSILHGHLSTFMFFLNQPTQSSLAIYSICHHKMIDLVGLQVLPPVKHTKIYWSHGHGELVDLPGYIAWWLSIVMESWNSLPEDKSH